jgi:DNA-binding CsgD family transcriptional regulator
MEKGEPLGSGQDIAGREFGGGDPRDVFGSGCSCAPAVWAALTQHPFLGVQLISADGVILFANDQAMQCFMGPDAKAADRIGRNVREWMPEIVVVERLAVLREVMDTGVSRLYRGIHLGRQVVSRISRCPVPTDGGETVAALIISMHVEGEVEETATVVEAKTVSWGPLASLSKRELEVLALIGEGLSMQQIADILHRSPHTVHDHRKSIGRKLGVDDRVRLAALAREAGLRVNDATRQRIEVRGGAAATEE